MSPPRDEIGQLARAFNRMTGELVAQRERLVQAERVAAWRELARRLAHELKNPLFPLQITVENMQRARDRSPEQFDEVFREGTATLLAELSQSEADHRPLQRFRQDAGAGNPAGGFQRSWWRRRCKLFDGQLAQARVQCVTAPGPRGPPGVRRIPSRSPACCATWC